MKKYILPITCILLAGCAQDNSLSTGETAKEYLEIWMEHWNSDNGKIVTAEESGIYILEDIPGTGDFWSADSTYTYGSTTIKTLAGKISSTNEEALSKQLGTYVVNGYYGPTFFATGEGASYAGVDAALTGMRMGGSRTVVIPSWMLTGSRYDSQEEYIDACTSTTHLIYTVKPVSQTSDVERVEREWLAEYVSANYPGLESTSYITDSIPNGSFYLKYVNDTLLLTKHTVDTTINLDYTGYRLDGTVFDTTSEKVAKDSGIYDSSKTYEPVSIAFSSTWDGITLGGSTTINGFSGALFLMDYWGQKTVAMFTSSHGYGSSGSGSAIPSYCPLVFELELAMEE